MQDLVGIVRLEAEMQEALTRLDALNRRAEAQAWRAIANITPVGTRASTCGI